MSRFSVFASTKVSFGTTLFIWGTAAYEAEVWICFSSVVYLSIGEQMLRRRISTRTGNDFGKAPHEMVSTLEWLRDAERNYTGYGAKIIDTSRSLNDENPLTFEESFDSPASYRGIF